MKRTSIAVEQPPRPDLTYTLEEVQKLFNTISAFTGPFRIGQAYFFRLATYHVTGRIKELSGQFIVLEDAAWIPDSGRFADFISGKIEPNECEPVGDWIINSAHIADAGPWRHKLPHVQR